MPLFIDEGVAFECGKYKGLRIVKSGMKISEGALIKKLAVYVNIHDHQFGFARGKSTTDSMLWMRQLQERYLEKQLWIYKKLLTR